MTAIPVISNMKLQTINTVAIISAIIGFVFTVLLSVALYKCGKPAVHETDENETVKIDKFSKKPSKVWKAIGIISKIIAIIAVITALVSMIAYSKLNTSALKHGAYDGIQKTQTVNDIIDNVNHGFVESTDIPDDLTGCILIFFKYGCPDCYDIHDDLVSYIEENDIKDIYFVSTRSEYGKNLIYPDGTDGNCLIDGVPSIIYYCKDNSDMENYHEYLYDVNDDGSKTFPSYLLDQYVAFREQGL